MCKQNNKKWNVLLQFSSVWSWINLLQEVVDVYASFDHMDWNNITFKVNIEVS